MPEEDLKIVMSAKDILKKGDFEEAFKRVLELVLKAQQAQAEHTAKLEETYQLLLNKMNSEHSSNYTTLQKKVNGLFAGERLEMSASQKKMFEALEGKIGKMIDQKLKDKVASIKPIEGKEGRPGRPPTQGEITQALYPSMEAFRKDWEEKVQQAMAQGRGGGGRQLRMTEFEFTGNGSTTTFTLPKEPGAKGKAIWVFYNGQYIHLTTHYTVKGKTLTTTFTPEAPPAGQTYNLEGYLIH